MSQAGGLRGEGQVPKGVENLWRKGKYAVLAMLFLVALPILFPVILLLLVLAIPVCVPVGCGIAAFLFVKKRGNIRSGTGQDCQRPGLDLRDWVDPCSISPPWSEGSSKSAISMIQRDADMFSVPASEPSNPSTQSRQHEPSTLSTPSRQHVQETEAFESHPEEPEEQGVQRLSGKSARGGSYMIKIPKTDSGSRGSNESSPVSTFIISESPAKSPSSTTTGASDFVDEEGVTTASTSPQPQPRETTEPRAGESQSESNIQGDSSISLSTPGEGSGQERKSGQVTVDESSGGNVEGTSSSGGPRTPEHVQQVPKDPHGHEHVQYVKDDSPKLGKRTSRHRKRKGRQAQAHAHAQDQ